MKYYDTLHMPVTVYDNKSPVEKTITAGEEGGADQRPESLSATERSVSEAKKE